MGIRNSFGQQAVGLFATCAVVLGGIVSCVSIVFASTTDPTPALLICGGCCGGFIVLAWLLRDKRKGEQGLLLYAITYLQRGQPRMVKYRMKRSANNPPPVPPSGPPTVEQIRDLTGGVGTWVPSGPGTGGRKGGGKNRPPRPGNSESSGPGSSPKKRR